MGSSPPCPPRRAGGDYRLQHRRQRAVDMAHRDPLPGHSRHVRLLQVMAQRQRWEVIAVSNFSLHQWDHQFLREAMGSQECQH
jgi:hypothetical protein